MVVGLPAMIRNILAGLMKAGRNKKDFVSTLRGYWIMYNATNLQEFCRSYHRQLVGAVLSETKGLHCWPCALGFRVTCL